MKFPHPRNQEVLDLFGEYRYVTLSGGGNLSSKTFVVSDLIDQDTGLNKLVWLVNDASEQEAMVRALKDWLDWDIEVMDTEGGERAIMRGLASLLDHRKVALVLTHAQFVGDFPSLKKLKEYVMTFSVGDELTVTDVFEALIEMDYEVSEDRYLEPGQYLRHGDVLDVFPINSEEPYRIELDFDKISSIYTYDQVDYKKM